MIMLVTHTHTHLPRTKEKKNPDPTGEEHMGAAVCTKDVATYFVQYSLTDNGQRIPLPIITSVKLHYV